MYKETVLFGKAEGQDRMYEEKGMRMPCTSLPVVPLSLGEATV